MELKKLADPFPANDVEWRLQECGKKGDKKDDKIWAMCLAYITNRAIMQRLDDVCGPENWKNDYRPGPQGGVICGISIKCGDEWVTKWDGADNTQVEATKGGLSDAMKRAGVQWGIGRYLYNLDAGFATIAENGEYRGKTKDNTYFKWNPPKLPTWALPSNDKAQAKPKESPPLPEQPTENTQQGGKSGAQGQGSGKEISEPTKARVDLLNELGQLFHGNREEMADALRTYSEFEGKDGKPVFLTLAQVEKATDNEKMHKWFGRALGALRKDSQR